MRALALILTSFLVLAALQASYLVVESKRHQKQQLARVHIPSSEDEHHQPVTGHHNKLINKPQQQQPVTVPGIDHKAKHALPKKPMQKVKIFGHWTFENPDHKASLVHKHHKKGHKGHKKGNKHKDYLHNPISPSHAQGQQHQRYKPHTEQPRYDQIKPAHDKAGHQMATKETIPGTQKPDVPTVNITIERVHAKNKHVPAHHMGSMHHMMMGDQPAETNTGRKADKKKKKKNNRDHKQKKNKRGKKKKVTENNCVSDTDCKEGQCCVEKKKGRKICKKWHFKHEGKRCLSSCVCKSGLECYVREVNKKGKPKKKKPGKQIVGHCVNPSKVDLTKGHFVTPTANSTVTPTPTAQG